MNVKKLLVVGELNVDLILNNIAGFPEIGTEIIADSLDLSLGGSSAIMAANSSVLGTDTWFCALLGEDQYGDFLLAQLKEKNVNTSYIKRSSELKTGITVVMSYDQDRANVTYCGAMNSLGITDIPWARIQDFHHLHISSYFLQRSLKKDIIEIFRRAKEAGLTTSLDLQFDPDQTWNFDYKNCLPFVDIFLPNEAEIRALTAKEDLEDAIREIIPYANILALKMGKEGARLYHKKQHLVVPPFINNRYKDAIGAGDSFNAGFISQFLKDAPLEQCLEYANLIGSLNTTAAGGTAAFSSKEAIDIQALEILNQH